MFGFELAEYELTLASKRHAKVMSGLGLAPLGRPWPPGGTNPPSPFLRVDVYIFSALPEQNW